MCFRVTTIRVSASVSDSKVEHYLEIIHKSSALVPCCPFSGGAPLAPRDRPAGVMGHTAVLFFLEEFRVLLRHQRNKMPH